MREPMVLPVRGAARQPREQPERQAGEARETARDAGAAAERPHDAHRLMEPDRDGRANALDQAHRDPRFRLGSRSRTRVLRITGHVPRTPVPRKVPVEVDSVRIVTRTLGGTVRIQAIHDPEPLAGWWFRPDQPAHDRDAGCLRSMDTADHEHGARRRGIARLDHPYRAPQSGSTGELAPVHRPWLRPRTGGKAPRPGWVSGARTAAGRHGRNRHPRGADPQVHAANLAEAIRLRRRSMRSR